MCCACLRGSHVRGAHRELCSPAAADPKSTLKKRRSPPPVFASLSLSHRILEMFLTRTEYDRGVNTVSPEGRLFQVEYAIEAIKLGSTAIGLRTNEGVVLAVEKRVTSPLLSRPFGVSLLIAGHDENGPSLYYTDPSGTFWQCSAKAIGSGSEGADSSLQEQYNKDLTLQEAETIALSILKQVMEEKVTPNNLDIARVAPTYHLYTPTEVEAVIARL
ncbi:unnamed protein product [Musa hybrid cultivar]